ncbi:hypothetical protein [Nitrosomonas sp. Nm166]|uniref:hypothetical protein n=1 Tax=Nitrosomonas sp. Nm166 TaxID=1881054 RepID=UPI0011602662|nr:hypothetical protein [Nitrosomonas sp. Nm166]
MPGIQLNHGKLLRWQRDGLLPRQHTCGTGPGQRQESLWDRSCIERLKIISSCVKAERLNRRVAEFALIAAHLGIQGDLLKKHLLAACDEMVTTLSRQQRGQSTDPVDRAENLERSTRDRMSAHGELVKDIFAYCRLGYTNLSNETERFKSLVALSSFFQPGVLRELIEGSSAEELELAYQNPIVVFFAHLIASLFDLLTGRNSDLPLPGLHDHPIARQMLEKFSPKLLKRLRRKKPYPYSKDKAQYYAHLTAVIFYLVYSQHKEAFYPLFRQVAQEILDGPEFGFPNLIKNIVNSDSEEKSALFSLSSLPK